MNMRRCWILSTAVFAGGCATFGYMAVAPGTIAVGGLNVTPSMTWNAAPAMSSSRKEAQIWTQDGLLLDRIMIIPAVPDGEPIFVTRDKTVALPAFRADMLPNEIEELVESSMVKYFGEGDSVVDTSGLRPHRFGEHRGVLFDFEAKVTESPDYHGMVGAFVANKLLYLIVYVAAEPYYYDKHMNEAKSIIETATL